MRVYFLFEFGIALPMNSYQFFTWIFLEMLLPIIDRVYTWINISFWACIVCIVNVEPEGQA